jgi:hypothetical protein
MRKNQKLRMERQMSTVRLDRDAFKRGVEDVMTLAPLRDAVRSATGAFMQRSEPTNGPRNAKPDEKRDVKQNDGKPARR